MASTHCHQQQFPCLSSAPTRCYQQHLHVAIISTYTLPSSATTHCHHQHLHVVITSTYTLPSSAPTHCRHWPLHIFNTYEGRLLTTQWGRGETGSTRDWVEGTFNSSASNAHMGHNSSKNLTFLIYGKLAAGTACVLHIKTFSHSRASLAWFKHMSFKNVVHAHVQPHCVEYQASSFLRMPMPEAHASRTHL